MSLRPSRFRPQLEALEDRFHLRNGNEAVIATEFLRGSPPKLDAGPVDRAVGLDPSVRRQVVDGDLERGLLRSGGRSAPRGKLVASRALYYSLRLMCSATWPPS